MAKNYKLEDHYKGKTAVGHSFRGSIQLGQGKKNLNYTVVEANDIFARVVYQYAGREVQASICFFGHMTDREVPGKESKLADTIIAGSRAA